MTWKETIVRWRELPAEEKLRRRWTSIPERVARSMAFEGEPVRLPPPVGDACPERAARFLETTRGVLNCAQLAPLLAERVLADLADVERGEFGGRPLDESLFLGFHHRIAGDLVPDWAGRRRRPTTRRHALGLAGVFVSRIVQPSGRYRCCTPAQAV